jgi:hypothetical protein
MVETQNERHAWLDISVEAMAEATERREAARLASFELSERLGRELELALAAEG